MELVRDLRACASVPRGASCSCSAAHHLRTVHRSDTVQHMDTHNPPQSRRARPHRIVVNVDTDTLQALRVLAFAGETSMSSVASEALRMLLPTLRPVIEAMAEIRTAPAAAMEKLSTHAEAVADLAHRAVSDIRKARGKPAPPSSNTGG